MTRALLIQNHNRARSYKMSILHVFFVVVVFSMGQRSVYLRAYNTNEIVRDLYV